jgi:hypothetical protein
VSACSPHSASSALTIPALKKLFKSMKRFSKAPTGIFSHFFPGFRWWFRFYNRRTVVSGFVDKHPRAALTRESCTSVPMIRVRTPGYFIRISVTTSVVSALK